jgi:MFS family permease
MKKSPLIVIFFTVFLDLLGFGLIIPVLPVFAKELGADNIQVGMIAGVYSLMNFLIAPLWGALSDRYGRRPIILMSIAITAASYLLFGFTSSLILLFLSRMMSGVGSANLSVAQAYISDSTTPENRAKSLGIIGAAFGLGFIFGPLVGGLVKSEFGISALGILACSLSTLNLALAYFLLPESIKARNKERKLSLFSFKDLYAVLQREAISSLFFINFIYITAFSMMQITGVILWKEEYGLDEKHIGYMFAFIGITSSVVQGGLIGKLNKMWGEQKLLTIGLSCMVFGLVSIPFAPRNEWFFLIEGISMFLLAFGSGCATPAANSLLSKLAHENEQGKVLGLNMSFSSLSRVIGPVLGGFCYNMHHAMPFLSAGVLMLGCFVLLFPLYPKLKAKGL